MFPCRHTRVLAAVLLCSMAAMADPPVDLDRAERESVASALAWLARNQELDGHWKATGGTDHGFGALYEPDAARDSDVLATSAALLAFLGDGSSPWSGPYREATLRAWKWLIAEQERRGGGALSACADAAPSATLGERQRAARKAHVARMNHLWGTLALLEVAAGAEFAGDGDVSSRAEARARIEKALPPAEAAVAFVTGDAALKPGAFDFLDERTVTMDELSLLAAIAYDAVMLRARMDRAWFADVPARLRDVQKGMTGTRVPYRASDEGVYWFGGSISTPQSMIAFVHLFERGSAEQMNAAGPGLLAQKPCWSTRYAVGAPARHPEAAGAALPPAEEMTNEYGWFWEGMAFRSYAALSADNWARWRQSFVPVAAANQRRSGAEAGSWDPAGPHARVFGRETGTAWMAITLESNCRLRMARTNWKDLKPRIGTLWGETKPTREKCAVCATEVLSNGVFSKGEGPKVYYFCGQAHLDEFESHPAAYREGAGEGGEGSHK